MKKIIIKAVSGDILCVAKRWCPKNVLRADKSWVYLVCKLCCAFGFISNSYGCFASFRLEMTKV